MQLYCSVCKSRRFNIRGNILWLFDCSNKQDYNGIVYDNVTYIQSDINLYPYNCLFIRVLK
jgi:hypothetical protein